MRRSVSLSLLVYSLLLAACGSPMSSSLATTPTSTTTVTKKLQAQKLENWKNNHFPRLDSDLSAMNGIEIAAQPSADFAAMRTACTTLQNDVYAAQQSLQREIPSTFNAPLKAALSYYLTEASDCFDYSQHLKTQSINQQTTTTLQHVYDPCAAGYLYDPPSNTCYPDQQLQVEQVQAAQTNRILQEIQWFDSFSANAGTQLDPQSNTQVTPTP